MRVLIIVALAIAVFGCATPITKNTGGISISADSTIGKDLIAAAENLDNAIRVGALDKSDPADGCIHDALQKAGIEVPAGQAVPESFVPKNQGAVSLGSIAYIRAQQLRASSGLVEVSVECKALIGTFVVDGLHDVKSVGLRALLFK